MSRNGNSSDNGVIEFFPEMFYDFEHEFRPLGDLEKAIVG